MKRLQVAVVTIDRGHVRSVLLVEEHGLFAIKIENNYSGRIEVLDHANPPD